MFLLTNDKPYSCQFGHVSRHTGSARGAGAISHMAAGHAREVEEAPPPRPEAELRIAGAPRAPCPSVPLYA